jgi:hypothetical protein
LRNRRKTGELYWDRLSVTPILDQDGKVAHYLALQEDVTGQKLAREDLNQSHAQLLDDLRRQSGDLARLNQAGELLRNCLTSEECYRGFAYGAELLAVGAGGARDARRRGPRERLQNRTERSVVPHCYRSPVSPFREISLWSTGQGRRLRFQTYSPSGI